LIAENPDRSSLSISQMEERILVLNRAQARLTQIRQGLVDKAGALAQEAGELQHEIARRRGASV
jgi:hypothetical protein